MKYHYGMISDKKREELKVHENRYIRGIKPAYNDFCVASEDETIVLYRKKIDPVQNEYVFWYGAVHMDLLVGEEMKKEKTEEGEKITYLEEIWNIRATPETDKEFQEKEKEIKEVLSIMLSMYIQNVNCLNKEAVVEVIDWEERRKIYEEANPALKRIKECLDKGVETSEADWAAIFGIPKDNKEKKQKKIYSGRSDLDAKYYFGALSDEKREELAALQITNMYGTKETFINRCVASEDELVVFCYMAYAHNYNQSGDEDECFFSYGSLHMRVFIKADREKEVTEKGNFYTEIYDIRSIVGAPEIREEFLKQKKEILNILKEVITFYVYVATGNYLNENDKRIVKVVHNGEEM